MKKLGEFIVEIIFPVIAVILTITVLFMMVGFIHTVLNEAKMRERAELIFHYDKNDYYIESYEYSGDQIIAVGVNGKEIIFPKSCTVIENIKGE